MNSPTFNGLGTLDDFLAAAQSNEEEITAACRPALDLLRRVDEAFRAYVREELPQEPTFSFLAINSYYAFLAGARIAISGQAAAVFPSLRSSVESACYAGQIHLKPELEEIWMHRQRDAKARKKCRDAFAGTIGATERHLGDIAEELGILLRDAYEGSIDFGAHPNSYSILHHLRINHREDDISEVHFTCLHGASSNLVIAALAACMELGLVSLIVLVSVGEDNERMNSLIELHHAIDEFIISQQNH